MTFQETPSSKIEARLHELVERSKAMSLDDSMARRKLLDISQTLCHELETPMEAIMRINVVQPVLYMSIRVAIDLDLFALMDKEESSPRTATHLAALLAVDSVLLGRLLKNIAAGDFLEETGVDTYNLTNVSRSLLSRSHRDGFPFCHDVLLPSFSATARYLGKTKYNNPSEIRNTPFQLGLNTKSSFFEWLGSHPDQNEQFNNFMGLYATDRPRWLDPEHFPVREIVGEGANTEEGSVLLVDVGGGKGHDLVAFQKMYPDLPGRLILQDLPSVVEQAGKLPEGLESMPHNFYTPQPIKGARAYYFHSVLHGLPDDKCLEMLQQITAAMKPGYSRLLLNEIVIPNEKAEPLATAMDLLMMTVVAAEERTENSWVRLLKTAGLTIVKIWTFERTEAVIHAELALPN